MVLVIKMETGRRPMISDLAKVLTNEENMRRILRGETVTGMGSPHESEDVRRHGRWLDYQIKLSCRIEDRDRENLIQVISQDVAGRSINVTVMCPDQEGLLEMGHQSHLRLLISCPRVPPLRIPLELNWRP